MADFEAEIRIAATDAAPAHPDSLLVGHHLVERAEIRATPLSGGHLMHLAVAGCLFNDILRAAKGRGVEINDLRVSANGGFEGEPLASAGINYEVELAADAPDEDLRALVADVEAKAAIPHTLRTGTKVEAGPVSIRGASGGSGSSS